METEADCSSNSRTRSAFEASPASWYVAGSIMPEMPEPDSDAELLRLVAAGGAAGAAAEGALCRRFGPRIRLYGLRHLRNEERAKDLVQAVLLGVLEASRAGRVSEPEHFERFVLGTCRNVALRMRDADGRATPVLDEELARLAWVEPPVADTTALIRCLDALDLRSKNVVMLSFHEERTAEEVASVLQITAGNVRVLRHRAVVALRRCLDGKAPQ